GVGVWRLAGQRCDVALPLNSALENQPVRLGPDRVGAGIKLLADIADDLAARHGAEALGVAFVAGDADHQPARRPRSVHAACAGSSLTSMMEYSIPLTVIFASVFGVSATPCCRTMILTSVSGI